MGEHQPRSVFCVIDGLHRDVAEAERVADGVFRIAGTTRRLGTTPDWLTGDFPADEEWRIEFSKFYYGLDLAHAYAETADDRYLLTWQALVSSWMAQVDVDLDPTDVIARRIQNWTYAWDRFARAGAVLGEHEVGRLLASLSDQAQHLRTNLATERNHRTLELYALLVVALAHPVLDPDGELAAFAIFELDRNQRADVLDDGVHRERSTHYHAIALRSFVATSVNAERFGLALPAGYRDRLGKACTFLATLLRPDGSLPMLSDSDDADHGDLLHLAADHLDRPDLLWVATSGKDGEAPLVRSTCFASGGYGVQRSGWGVDETGYSDECQLIFDIGPVGDSGHGHYDALHVECYGSGQPLLVDPGRFTYSEAGPVNWRHWFKGTAAHNTVCVDQLDQVPYRRGKQKGPTSQTRFLGAAHGQGAEQLLAEVISPVYDALHQRRVVFVNRSWWLIEDTLRAHEVHQYDLRFHLWADAWGRVTTRAASVASPGLRLLFPETTESPTIEDGWIARSYGERDPAPVVSLKKTATATRFLTMVVPHAADDDEPIVVAVGDDHLDVAVRGTTGRLCWGSDAPTWEVTA